MPTLAVGSSPTIDMITISTTAIGFIHLYLSPLFQEPTWKLEPSRQRRKIGIANARYSPITPIETTAKKATGLGAPLMSTVIRAGRVRISAMIAAAITALAGTRLAFSLEKCFAPGIAPSRLNAKNIRLVLVMHATVQKNWPAAEMATTKPATCGVSA